MADPTRSETQKIDLTRPGSKFFDPDPSLGHWPHYQMLFIAQTGAHSNPQYLPAPATEGGSVETYQY